MSSLVRDDYKYTHISTATTTQAFTGNGRLIRVVLNEATSGAVTIYDETGSGNSTVVAIIASSTAAQFLDYGVKLTTGLKVITAGADDITLVWTLN